MSILKQINEEIQNFQDKNITIVPGFAFNQHTTVEKIIYYYNSRFTTGEFDDEGDRKFFFNINRNPVKVFSKSIDFDTKNIRLLTTESGNPLKTWFMERDLKYWMRDKQFGKILNRLFNELPVYGSVVLKIVNGQPHFVDLRNFVVQQSADTLEGAGYITEIRNLTPQEFKKIGKKMNWKQSDIDEVIKQFHASKNFSHIRLYERYGEVEEDDGKGNKTYPYKRVFLADVGVDEFNQKGDLIVEHPGIELSSDNFSIEELSKLYWEFHTGKIPGRWLGVGVVESLFEPQTRQNEIANLQSKASYWSALKIFQTRDETVNRNMLTDTRNGEILNVGQEITQVNMSDNNLAFFNQETVKWMGNRDELTFSFDVVQGERLPAGTPLGSAKIAIGQTLSYFEQIQEDVAMDVKEMLYQVIIPQFEKENTGKHTLRLVGQDLDTYIAMVRNELVLKEIIRQASRGAFPTSQDRETMETAIEESIKQGKEKILDIPKNFYKDVKYDIDIDITGESVDTRVRQATKFALLQAIQSDPAMTQDPTKRKILFAIAEDGGINPHELFDTEKKDLENFVPQGRGGGGVSAPALGQAIEGAANQTV